MSADPSPALRRELLDDFYAECDELLSNSRNALVALERNAGQKSTARAQLETLSRQVHSIKGNSAIVGLRPAEELAHAMEDLLRGLIRGEITLAKPVIDTLLTSTQGLEQIITAHRLGKRLPGIADTLAEVRRHVPQSPAPRASAPVPPAAEPEPAMDDGETARARGLELWRAVFTPSPELDRRGINVTTVRTRLGAAGEILRATPIVRDKTITFEFSVGLKQAPDRAAWERDGVHLEPVEAPAPTGEADTLTPSHIVRVDLARLDDLMRILGDMVVQRSRLDDRIGQVTGDTAGLREVQTALSRSLRELRGAITRIRLVPVAEIFTRMPFAVRELVRDSEKLVRVTLEGQQTVIDKFLVERLKEPLLHLVRNAFAHGIETAAARVAAGKAAEATITLRATAAGEAVVIQVSDDGRGIDTAAVRARAEALGFPGPEPLDDEGLLAILCQPGFSTRDEADLAAGRGVGMAVVASTVRELGGRLSLRTWPGLGTEFSLRLPVTLSIIEAIAVSVGDQACAVPQIAVAEIIQISAAAVRLIRQTEVIPYRDGLLPLVRLRRHFGVAAATNATLTVVVLHGERGATGLVVDRVHTQREVVVRPLTDPLLRVPGVAGATELGDGRPVLILDPVAITNGVVRPAAAEVRVPAATSPAPSLS